jgi:hypothetical protein
MEAFEAKWDANGLLTGVVTHAGTGELLMVAMLNAEALDATLRTGLAATRWRCARCGSTATVTLCRSLRIRPVLRATRAPTPASSAG